MNESKLHLSADEMMLAGNKEIILTKLRIIEKVYGLLGQLALSMQQYNGRLPVDYQELLNRVAPKISKGEQYRKLPYAVLDYPRLFGKEDVLAVRTFFWWGNFFSTTLHLKGKYIEQAKPAFFSGIRSGKFINSWYSIDGDEFDFDVYNTSYNFIDQHSNIKTDEGDASKWRFLKLSRIYSLQQWNSMPNQLLADYSDYIELLA